jgi:hypothetical protein
MCRSRRSLGGDLSIVSFLTISGTTNAWNGQLDMTDSAMVVDYHGASPIATIANQIKTGYAGSA